MFVTTEPGKPVQVGPQTAFGELRVSDKIPIVQLDAVYGLQDLEAETFSLGTGAVTVEDTGTGREFRCSTGASAGSYGLLRSKAALRYRPGVGATGRFTARYSTPAAGSEQRAGFIGVGNELTFGYWQGTCSGGEVCDGTQFGILHRRGGLLEIQTLTITTPAGGSETATVTLNGNATNANLTSGTAAETAAEIAATSFSGYDVFAVGSTVVFIAQAVGPQAGAFSFSSDGDAVGTFAETQAGRAVTDVFYQQKNWNEFDMPDLDPTKGTPYQIEFQYLGYGAIKFFAEDPATGEFRLVHVVDYANNNTSPNLGNPSLKVGVFAFNATNTSDIQVHSASIAGFIDGNKNFNRPPIGAIAAKSSIGTTDTPVISIRNSKTHNGYVNLRELLPLVFSFAVDGTKPAEVRVWLNSELTGAQWEWAESDASSPMQVDTSATAQTTTNARLIYAAAVAKTGSDNVFFPGGAPAPTMKLYRGDTLTVSIAATSGTTDATASITVMEE